jgi:hypothetical protein
MNKVTQIIREEISAIKKDKNKEIFDYRSITEDAWREILQKAMTFQKVHFDTENDDSTGEKKTFYIKKNLRKDQPIKYEINAELFEAGGDWENPIIYFRIEFTHEYGIFRSDKEMKDNKPEYVWDLPRNYSGLYRSFCIIPPNEAGNKLEKRSDNEDIEWAAYDSNDIPKEKEKELRITTEDKRKAWNWLAKLLEKVIDKRHKMLDDNNSDDLTAKDSAEPEEA